MFYLLGVPKKFLLHLIVFEVLAFHHVVVSLDIAHNFLVDKGLKDDCSKKWHKSKRTTW